MKTTSLTKPTEAECVAIRPDGAGQKISVANFSLRVPALQSGLMSHLFNWQRAILRFSMLLNSVAAALEPRVLVHVQRQLHCCCCDDCTAANHHFIWQQPTEVCIALTACLMLLTQQNLRSLGCQFGLKMLWKHLQQRQTNPGNPKRVRLSYSAGP